MRQLGRIFPLFLAASAPAWAQWLLVEHNAWQDIAPPPKKAVIADITATLTAQTPWGPFTNTETGKYWRSRSGKVRQDFGDGLSWIVDLSGPVRSRAYVDHDHRRIWVEVGSLAGTQSSQDATGNDFRFGAASSKPKKSGRDVMEGFKVTIRTGELLNAVVAGSSKGRPTGESYEIWTADELGVILLFKLKSGTTEFVQRYHNIRLEEPESSVFELPFGFRMVTRLPDPYRRCMRLEEGISGEPGHAETRRYCSGP